MSYFTAVLSRSRGRWRVHDLDLEDVGLTALVDELRLVADDDEPVLVFVEREDEWWAVLRVDGEEDPRVFVSDVPGSRQSPYGELFAVEPTTVDEEESPTTGGGCGGDLDVLADLGTTADRLRELCEDGALPMDALAEIAEAGGFAEVLDSLR